MTRSNSLAFRCVNTLSWNTFRDAINAKVPAYWVVNVHTSYQLTENVQIYGLIQNLFDQRYYSIGTFVNTAGFTSATPGGATFLALNDPRTFVPGMPFTAYAGIRAKF